MPGTATTPVKRVEKNAGNRRFCTITSVFDEVIE